MSTFNTERLAQVLVAPIMSEKGTYVADKHEQVMFAWCETPPSPRSRPRSS